MSTLIEFDEAAHLYRVGRERRIVPGIHDIFHANGIGGNPYPAQLEAMEFGKYAHKTTQLFDEGRLNEATLHPRLRGPLDAWKRFRDEIKPVIVSMGDVAASGGYLAAVRGDVIVAQPTTITASRPDSSTTTSRARSAKSPWTTKKRA